MHDLLQSLLADLDTKKAVEHIEWFTHNTPNRTSGKGQDLIAAQYICDQMESYGLKSQILQFEAYNSHGITSQLKVVSPETVLIDSLPCCHVASTRPEGMELELVYMGSGGENEYAGKDVKGKAILVEVSYSPATPEKAMIAAKHGVAAMICMNWGTDQPYICNRALKAVWGNPTPESFGEIPQIAGISISRKSGEYLRDLCRQGGPVKIHLTVEATRHWEKLPQPLAILEGSEEPEKFLLVSAHLDAWEPGVTCNATGLATILELGRVFGKHKDKIKRSIYFTNWNGHEIAEAAGSTWFQDYFFENVRKNCIGYINIDSTGMRDCTIYENEASRELSDYAYNMVKEVLGEDSLMYYLEKTGDQSFFGVGVPSIAGRVGLAHELIVAQNGACLGWWNHTSQDGLDKMDPAVMEKDDRVDVGIVLGLVNAEILPYNFTKTTEYLQEKLAYIHEESGNIIDLTQILLGAQKLTENVNALNEKIACFNRGELGGNAKNYINDTLLYLSRTLTNTLFTYSDKYGQDSYGKSILSKPIPLLYGLVDLAAMDPESLEYKLRYTELLRNRNRVADAVTSANQFVELTLALLAK